MAAAAAKLVAVRSAPRTTTSTHHRPISTAPLAASSATTPVAVSLSSLQHHNKQESVVAIEKGAVSPASGSCRAEAMMEDCTPSLASMWQEVQGAGDWHGLVDPLHPVLRAEIVRYGELVAACYRAFDLDPRSKRYLNCKHGKTQMLPASIGMAGAGYTVTKYIYAAPDLFFYARSQHRRPGRNTSRWIGYVAVASDEQTTARLGRRDILVSFCGTVTGSEWLANFMSMLTPARFDPADPRPDVRVESGFLSLYTSDDGNNNNNRFSAGSCRNQLLSEISRLVAEHGQEEHGISITLAGHSMGSSLALLLGYDLAELGLNRNTHHGRIIPITVFSFAGPRVGNREFRDRCDDLGVKVLRVVNVNDPVTKMPGFVFNDGARALAGRYGLPWGKACCTHVGVEVALDFFKAGDIACAHDLEAYIDHLLKCGANNNITVPQDELVLGI
ncbi:hypothetical protein QOZ80_9BG0704230 [Eleusine coracana subsp. coracana]|nr:hypothetical protein QOZ80_9BG0704230 [Eleusine coracana subsp. coracana]